MCRLVEYSTGTCASVFSITPFVAPLQTLHYKFFRERTVHFDILSFAQVAQINHLVKPMEHWSPELDLIKSTTVYRYPL
jgi:hypothetical protein